MPWKINCCLFAVCLTLVSAAYVAAEEVGKGYVLFEYWNSCASSGGGRDVFVRAPDSSEWRPGLVGPTDRTDICAVRARAFLLPPADGQYTFWISGGDQSQLWLSSDSDPSHSMMIADVAGWASSGSSRKSAPIDLRAGQKYFIMAQQKGSNDGIAVTWAGPVVGYEVPICPRYLIAYIRNPEPLVDIMTRPTDEAAVFFTEYDPAVPSNTRLSAVRLDSGIPLVIAASGFIQPTDVALNPTETTAFVIDEGTAASTFSGRLLAVDASTGMTTIVASGLRRPKGIVLNCDETIAYVVENQPTNNGKLLSIDLGTGTANIVASGLRGPRSVDLDRDATTAYVTTLDDGRLSAIDLSTGAVRTVVSGLNYPTGVAVSYDESRAWVAEFLGDRLACIDIASGTIACSIPIDRPRSIAINARSSGDNSYVEDEAYVTQLPLDGNYKLVKVHLLAGTMTTIATGLKYPGGVALGRKPPLPVKWSTYLGGSGYDAGDGIAVDGWGNIYVTGSTSSPGWTRGGTDTIYDGDDVFVAKLSPSGQHIWSTYLGGSEIDHGIGIAVDASGNVYVTGETFTPGWMHGGLDTTYNSGGDAFVAKLSPDGAHIWSTYLGGNDEDWGRRIALDGSGNIYVTGGTHSIGWTRGGFDTGFGGPIDAFVAKLSPDGAHIWSTYLGGDYEDYGGGIAVDASGNVYVTGTTWSPGWTQGGFDTSLGAYLDAFVAKLSSSGQHMWSTHLGGGLGGDGYVTGSDYAWGIAADASGNVYVTGYTESVGWTCSGFDTTYNSNGDAFVAKLGCDGAHVWSTYLGGGDWDWAQDIAVDALGNVHVAGTTQSPGWTHGGFAAQVDGLRDAFVIRLSPDGAHVWSTYLGGGDWDWAGGIAVDISGNVYMTGTTWSPGWTSGGFDTTYDDQGDAFVVKLSEPQ